MPWLVKTLIALAGKQGPAKDAEVCKGDVELFVDSPLPSGEVKVGDKSHGFIAFDMAPGAATVVIREPLLQ